MSAANTVLITGTSSGIGLEAAVAAARSGWQTIATMRDPARATALLEAADAAGVAGLVRVEALDVTDPESVQRCVKTVIADYGRLDAVVNNMRRRIRRPDRADRTGAGAECHGGQLLRCRRGDACRDAAPA